MHGTAADEHFEQEVRQHYRYNFVVHVVEGALAMFGFGCAAVDTVLPAYLSLLGVSNFLIALAQHLFNTSWTISMLFFAYLVQRHRTRKWPTVWYGLLVRVMLVVWGVTALAATPEQPLVGIVGVYGGLLLMMASAGPSELCWTDLMSRIIPQERRGWFMGVRHVVVVLAGLAGAWVVFFLIGPADQAQPNQFGVPFLIGAAAFMVSLPFVAITREPVHPDEPPRVRGYWTYLRQAYGLLQRDRVFRRYVVVRMALGVTGLYGSSLLAAYALGDFGISARTVTGPFTTAVVVAGMVSAPLFGWLGDRRGYRLVFCIAVACGAAFSLVGLSLPLWSQPVYGFCLCYALAGLAGTAGFIAAFNMTFEFADVHSRSLYIAVVATLSSVVVVVVGGVGGKLVDCFGHGPLLAASAVVNLWAGLMVVWLLPEPRRLVPAQIATHVERV